jgi:hypothetical protein
VYIETIQDVIDVLSGQELLPFVRVLDKEEESKKSERNFNQIMAMNLPSGHWRLPQAGNILS